MLCAMLLVNKTTKLTGKWVTTDMYDQLKGQRRDLKNFKLLYGTIGETAHESQRGVSTAHSDLSKAECTIMYIETTNLCGKNCTLI